MIKSIFVRIGLALIPTVAVAAPPNKPPRLFNDMHDFMTKGMQAMPKGRWTVTPIESANATADTPNAHNWRFASWRLDASSNNLGKVTYEIACNDKGSCQFLRLGACDGFELKELSKYTLAANTYNFESWGGRAIVSPMDENRNAMCLMYDIRFDNQVDVSMVSHWYNEFNIMHERMMEVVKGYLEGNEDEMGDEIPNNINAMLPR